MINIRVSGDSLLDLLVLHGDEAVDAAFDTIKDEFYDQVSRLKASGEYQEYSEALHQTLKNKAT